MTSSIRTTVRSIKLAAEVMTYRDPYSILKSTLHAVRHLNNARTRAQYVLPAQALEHMLIDVECRNTTTHYYEKQSTPFPAIAAYLAHKLLTYLPAQENYIDPLASLEAYSFAFRHTPRMSIYGVTPAQNAAMAGLERQVDRIIALQLHRPHTTVFLSPRPIPLDAFRQINEALCHSALGSPHEFVGFECLAKMARASSTVNAGDTTYLQSIVDAVDTSETSVLRLRANLRRREKTPLKLSVLDPLQVFENIKAWVKLRETDAFSREPFRRRLTTLHQARCSF